MNFLVVSMMEKVPRIKLTPRKKFSVRSSSSVFRVSRLKWLEKCKDSERWVNYEVILWFSSKMKLSVSSLLAVISVVSTLPLENKEQLPEAVTTTTATVTSTLASSTTSKASTTTTMTSTTTTSISATMEYRYPNSNERNWVLTKKWIIDNIYRLRSELKELSKDYNQHLDASNKQFRKAFFRDLTTTKQQLATPVRLQQQQTVTNALMPTTTQDSYAVGKRIFLDIRQNESKAEGKSLTKKRKCFKLKENRITWNC